MSNFSMGSARRVASQIIDFREERLQEVLSSFEPEFKRKVVKIILEKRIERSRNND